MTKVLPLPTGTYLVGLFKIDLYDPYRKEMSYPEGRLIPIQFYFPVEKGNHKSQPKVFEQRAPQNFPRLEVMGYSKLTDFSHILPGKHPLIILNHANLAAMTDYACIAEELASHGYVVVTIQHQLNTDPISAPFSSARSTAKHSHIIDNILYVFEWIKEHYSEMIDANKVGLIGHSMGGNALLLLANRVSSPFRESLLSLLPRELSGNEIRECIVFIDGEFSYPMTKAYPILFCLSDERKFYQESIGTMDDLTQKGYSFHHYKGTRHISFMDHSSVLEETSVTNEKFFNGTESECKFFWKKLRSDILGFLRENGV